MNRPSYKKLYLKEKNKTKFSYNLLTSIVDMLNQLGIEAEIEKRFRYDSFCTEAILKTHNPANSLYGCIGINMDFLEGAEIEKGK